MAVNNRGTCAHCGNERRKPLPLGPVMGLSAETENLLVCRPCQNVIRAQFRVCAEIRLRLQMTLDFKTQLALGSCPE